MDKSDIIFNNFEWNQQKSESNLQNHGISFEEASTVFADPFFIIFKDIEHSKDEQRFIIIGASDKLNYLFVSFTERDERTRIISARELTSKERKDYEKRIQS